MIKITSQEESEQEGRLLFVRVRGLNFETSPQKKKKKKKKPNGKTKLIEKKKK